jgi:putative hydrolase of the HAD superfamily
MSKVKAVVFDYGKVLSLPPNQQQWLALSTRFGKPPHEFQPIYWGKNREELDRGTLDNVAYWRKVGRDCGLEISDSDAEQLIDHDSAQWTSENPAMLELARELRRAGYQTAILSNMEHRLLAVIRSQLPWLAEFDVQMYSCEVGAVKPEPAIYLECCRRLACQPQEALFLDDKKSNTEAAKQVGMQSYVYQSGDDPVMNTGDQEITVAELRAMLLNGSL